MASTILKIWARAIDHLIGNTDSDEPVNPILTRKQNRIALLIRSLLIILNILSCIAVICNVIHHW